MPGADRTTGAHRGDDPGTDPAAADAIRAQPAYGQYATAQEQRARIAVPDASVALEAGVAPVPVRTRATAVALPGSEPSLARRRSMNRIVTLGLLVYGLVNVAMSAISLVDFPTVATLSMEMIGVPGEFTNVAQGRLLGTIAAVALVVGWVVTALGSWRRLRAGRVAWWVPLVGAVVSYVVVYAILTPAFLNDPAFVQYLGSAGS